MLALPRDGCHLAAFRPREHRNAVGVVRLRIPERRGYLPARRAPYQAGHLRVDSDGGKRDPGRRVVEVYTLVMGPATGGDKAIAPRTECDGLYGCVMFPAVFGMPFLDRARFARRVGDWISEVVRGGAYSGGKSWGIARLNTLAN